MQREGNRQIGVEIKADARQIERLTTRRSVDFELEADYRTSVMPHRGGCFGEPDWHQRHGLRCTVQALHAARSDLAGAHCETGGGKPGSLYRFRDGGHI